MDGSSWQGEGAGTRAQRSWASAERRLRRRARAGPLRNLFRCARLFRQEYGVPFPRRYEAG